MLSISFMFHHNLNKTLHFILTLLQPGLRDVVDWISRLLHNYLSRRSHLHLFPPIGVLLHTLSKWKFKLGTCKSSLGVQMTISPSILSVQGSFRNLHSTVALHTLHMNTTRPNCSAAFFFFLESFDTPVSWYFFT